MAATFTNENIPTRIKTRAKGHLMPPVTAPGVTTNDIIRIKRFVARPVIVPISLPLQTSTAAVNTAPLVLIDCETDQGVRGHSYVFSVTPAALKPLAGMVNEMSAMLAGDELIPSDL